MIIDSKNLNNLIKILEAIYIKNNKLIAYSLSVNRHSMVQDWMLFGNYLQIYNYFNLKTEVWNGSPEDSFFYSYLLSTGEKDLNILKASKHFDFCIDQIRQYSVSMSIFKGRRHECDIKFCGSIDKTHTNGSAIIFSIKYSAIIVSFVLKLFLQKLKVGR